jgi:hypothetical protein
MDALTTALPRLALPGPAIGLSLASAALEAPQEGRSLVALRRMGRAVWGFSVCEPGWVLTAVAACRFSWRVHWRLLQRFCLSFR